MKFDKILIRIGWYSELFLTVAIVNIGYFFIFTHLDKPDKILLIAIFLILFITNLTKIPIATAFIFAETIFYRLLFFITLMLLMIVSFESYIQVFELYIVNNNSIDQLIKFNELTYFFLSFIFTIIGVIFALPGLFMEKLKQNEEKKKYLEELQNG
mgnify:FL=1